MDLGREEYLASLEPRLRGGRDATWELRPLATRGDRLALLHNRAGITATDAVESVIEVLVVDELDESGCGVRTVLFDPNDLDAAYEELDRRYAEIDDPPRAWHHLRRWMLAFNGNDRAAAVPLFAPSFRLVPHQPLGWGELERAAYLDHTLALADIRPDVRLRIHHVLATDDRRLMAIGSAADAAGIDFAAEAIAVIELDDHGLEVRRDMFRSEQLKQAWVRYHELDPAPPDLADLFPNGVTRRAEAMAQAFSARDFEAFSALMAPEYRFFLRRGEGMSASRDEYLADIRPRWGRHGMRWRTQALATRGDRLALIRLRHEGAGGWSGSGALAESWDAGETVLDDILVSEVDDEERAVRTSLHGPADLDAAYEELDRWYSEQLGDGPEAQWLVEITASIDAYNRATGGRPEPWASAGRIHDHRLTGARDYAPEEWFDAANALRELAESPQVALPHVIGLTPRGAFAVIVLTGSYESGPYEIAQVHVHDFRRDAPGVERLHIYDLDGLDEARALWAQLCEPRTSVQRAMDTLQAAGAAHDWDALRAVFADGPVLVDRRTLVGISGDDADVFVEAAKALIDVGPSPVSALVGARGDRLGAWATTWTAEYETITVVEVDDSGRITAFVVFDGDDLLRASQELDRRFAAGEGAPYADVIDAIGRFRDAFAAHDVAALRAVVAPEFTLVERRRMLGMLSFDGAESAIEALQQFWVVAPEATAPVASWLALDGHGAVLEVSRRGQLTGGGPLEDSLTCVLTVEGGRITRFEGYDDSDRAVALARLNELRPTSEVLATAGQRLRVEQHTNEVRLVELDAAGQVIDMVSYDGQRGEAMAEMWMRYFDGEGSVYPAVARVLTLQRQLMRSGDWEHFRTLFADDFASVDHQQPRLYPPTSDPDTWVDLVRTYCEASPDVDIESGSILAIGPRGLVNVAAATGVLAGEGDQFRNEWLNVIVLGDDDRISRIEFFDPADADAAIARFHGLCPTTKVLATAGERLRVEQTVDGMRLVEVDAEGTVTDVVPFERRGDALEGMWRRYFAGEGSAYSAVGRVVLSQRELMRKGDWEQFRTFFADDVVSVDHQEPRLYPPATDSDSWIDLVRTYSAASSEFDFEYGSILAICPRGVVSLSAATGSMPDGGDEFRNEWVSLTWLGDDGRIARVEFFDGADVDTAIARFRELGVQEAEQ